MIRIHLFLAIFLSAVPFFTATAQNRPVLQLSDQAKISVVTMWPGPEIYIAFGHSGLRVSDPVLGIDLIFNYGSFDMRDPLFVPRFVQGELNYYLSTYSFEPYFKLDIQYENRIWKEQRLKLSPDQNQALFNFLANNSKPQNRYYLYDFIADNCATRIRDALVSALGDKVSFPAPAGYTRDKSFRELLDEHVGKRPLWQLSFYLVLGTASDRPANAWAAMFLPFYLLDSLNAAQVTTSNGPQPLAGETTTLYQPATPPYYDSENQNPAFILWPLLGIVATASYRQFIHFKRMRRNGLRHVRFSWTNAGDTLLFLIAGVMGCIMFYLEFFSIHTAVKGNLNLVWMWPLHLVMAFACLGRRPGKFQSGYFLAAALACLVPLVAWPIWPQVMHPTMIPIMFLLAIRAFMRYQLYRTRTHRHWH